VGLVSVLADQYPADNVWHCLMGGTYTVGTGNMPGNSLHSWSQAGMANWGSTCGIATSCAAFAECALPRAQTNGVIDKIFAYYAEGEHPFNEAWFLSGKVNPRDPVDFKIKYGTLQCHNVVAQHRNRGYFLEACGENPSVARQEFCATLCGALAYETMRQIGAVRNGIPTTFTQFSSVRDGCGVAGCHQDYLTASYLPKEDCYACHK
jgi:hypothetical protein